MQQQSTQPIPSRPTWRELSGIAAIQLASFRKDLAYKRWMLVIFWMLPGIMFLATRDDDRVTGSIIADIHRGKIRIMNIAVDPAYRKQGLGQILMHAAIDAKPNMSVVLMVQEENTAARALYTGMGFERTGYSASYYGPGYAGIEMTLKRA